MLKLTFYQQFSAMNWVGGARSRIKQSHERKIQKEFFERQKLAKKVNIEKQLSPKGKKKPVSLDLLSLQTINLTHGGENATTQRRQPVKVILGDRTNLLSRRQEDLELPMSPIRHPSTLMFTDIKTEKDSYNSVTKPTHSESLLQAGNANNNSLETSPAIKRNSQVGYSSRSNNRNMFEESLMSESLLSCHDMSLEHPPLSKYPKKQPTQKFEHGHAQSKNRKEDLLAFQRAEKEKHMSSKPTMLRQPMHLVKPVEKERHTDKPATLNHNEESPTAFKIPQKAPHKLEGISTHKPMGTSGTNNNNGLSDKERKTLLGLDFEAKLDSAEDKRCVPVFKKAKATSSFEQMINNYEKPAKTKTVNSVGKGAAKSRHEEWRKFTHKTKESPHIAYVHQVPDTSTTLDAPNDNKTSLFFRQRAPKKQILPKIRPSTVLQELLCMDEDLNNSDLFLTQDFTFEERLDIDFEEPFQHTQENKSEHVATVVDKLPFNHYTPPVEEQEILDEGTSKEQPVWLPKYEEQLVHLPNATGRSQDLTTPKEQSRESSSNTPSRSVGIQCNRTVDISDMGTQTIGSVFDARTQTEMVTTKSITTDTSDLLPNDQPSHSLNQSSNSNTNTDDRLALAQSTIVWQSLMIKLLKIDAKYNKS